jgi:hypothetical protein
MQGRTGNFTRAAVIAATLLTLQAHTILAANRLSLRKNADNSISVGLSNADAIAGAQFSINARVGIALQSFEGADRLVQAGVGVFQFRKDESTLNIVLLAPPMASLSAGEGVIGKISFVPGGAPGADSARVCITNVMLCDVAARELDATTSQLAWSLFDTPRVSFTLEHNYPNPFNPSTTIGYSIKTSSHVRLEVYDIAGRMVSLLLDQQQQPGRYSIQWNADKDGNVRLSSGMYFARLRVGGEVAVIKMILTK